jgi:Kef-type K+ transport system membrane component KefB
VTLRDPTLINLLLISVVAFTVPFVLGLFPRIRIPAAVAEIVAGIIVGPSVLGWIHFDSSIQLVSTIGVAFLLFLAGMALDLHSLKGAPLVLGSIGFVLSIGIGGVVETLFRQKELVSSPFLVAIALSATSLGIVVPVLRDTGYLDTPTGVFTLAGGSAAEFGTIVLLGVFFSDRGGTPAKESALLVVVAAVAVLLLWGLTSFSRFEATRRVLRLQAYTSWQVRVRLAWMIMLAGAVLAVALGFQAILGTFIGGAVFAVVIAGWDDEKGLRNKLDAVGFGFFVPVFFVASGMHIDLSSLAHVAALARVAALVGVLLLVRALPALLYRRHLSGRETLAAGLLQATNISFIVVATTVGERLHAITVAGSTGLIAAGLISALVFPPVAQRLLSAGKAPAGERAGVGAGDGGGHPTSAPASPGVALGDGPGLQSADPGL